MEGESPTQASTPAGAVFLSYASEDAEAARRICEALRAAGIEVWLDQSELRGGEAWDRQIRERIHSCRLFIALISNHTQARDEGYFRREWKLAVDRTHDMLERKAFLLPIVIDATPERGAAVPDKFHEVQWTRLPGGHSLPAFIEHVRHLLSPERSHAPTVAQRPAGPVAGATPAAIMPPTRRSVSRPKLALLAIVAVVGLGAIGYFAVDKFSKHAASPPAPPAAPASAAAAAFSPPPHSIAVLPFVNMSRDKDQEYFSDGLTEELINSLARISELQVSARTSSFSFKGKDADLGTIARKLNVSSVLEGSVRRSGNTIRITAQLNNAVTGFHLWSQTYDHDLSNVLQLQTEIANAVASALKVTLLGDVGARLEVGGTRNPAAYDAYLRAESAYWQQKGPSDLEKGIADYREAVRLDSNFGRAYAEWSIALAAYGTNYAQGAAKRDWFQHARLPAFKAVAVTPDLAEGHLALAFVHVDSLDLRRANEEFERAVTLAPGNARILRNYALFAVVMGHTDAGIASARRAAVLDPLNVNSQDFLATVLRIARRYEEAMVAYQHAISLDRDSASLPLYTGARIYYAIGDFDKMRSECERFKERFEPVAQNCLALAYHKLGRHADAESALAREKALEGDAGAVDYGRTYAQWGDIPKALDWLETAWRLRDWNLVFLKNEPLFDPLRREPRFQALVRELEFPD